MALLPGGASLCGQNGSQSADISPGRPNVEPPPGPVTRVPCALRLRVGALWGDRQRRGRVEPPSLPAHGHPRRGHPTPIRGYRGHHRWACGSHTACVRQQFVVFRILQHGPPLPRKLVVAPYVRREIIVKLSYRTTTSCVGISWNASIRTLLLDIPVAPARSSLCGGRSGGRRWLRT
jgi:hypothetical protein